MRRGLGEDEEGSFLSERDREKVFQAQGLTTMQCLRQDRAGLFEKQKQRQ